MPMSELTVDDAIVSPFQCLGLVYGTASLRAALQLFPLLRGTSILTFMPVPKETRAAASVTTTMMKMRIKMRIKRTNRTKTDYFLQL